MSETKKNTLTIDEVEHDIDTMTEEQKMMVHHINDLDRKIGNSQFNPVSYTHLTLPTILRV